MAGGVAALLQKWYPIYDIIYGLGVDYSTGRFILQPNPGIAGSPGIARVIFYTPSGSNTGPTNVNAFGSTFATYTRTTLAGCKALQRTVSSTLTSRPSGYGDWVLFPSGTLTFPVNSETYWGEVNSAAGASQQYPTVFGTYDSSNMTNPAGWNHLPCLLDFSNVAYALNANGFFFNLGRFEGNIGFVNLQMKKTLATTILPFYTANGARKGVFMERCTMDGAAINITAINNGLGSNGASLQTLSAITASGTTATATCTTLVTPNIQNANSLGVPLYINISGDTSGNGYNGTWACTYVDSTHFSFTVSPAPAGPATGTLVCGVVTALLPDGISVTNIVFNQCGFGYYGTLTAAHSINVQLGAAAKYARFYNCVMVHGGWNRTGSRSASVYNPGTTKYPITSLTRSGTTVTALCPTTGTLHAGGFVAVSASNYNTNSAITSITANTSFTYEVDQNGAPATMGGAVIQGHLSGNTLTVDSLTSGTVAINQVLVGAGVTQCSITAGSGTSWTFSGSTQTVGSAGSPITINCCPYVVDPEANGSSWTTGAIPDVFSHGYYIENDTYDIKMYGCVTAWDCVNSKWTGGPWYVENHVSIRNPIEYIIQSYGNDTTGNTWPTSAVYNIVNSLCLFAQDLDPGSPRGNAGQVIQPGVGSSINHYLLLNASNNLDGANSVASRSGPATFANTGGYAVYQPLSPFTVAIRHGMSSGWGVTDTTDFSSSGTTKTFSYNITGDDPSALPGTGNYQFSGTPTALQTAMTNTLALDIANTFRLSRPELSGVTVAPGTGTGQGLNNAANLQTEQNILDFMMYNPGYPWAYWLHAHFRQYLG